MLVRYQTDIYIYYSHTAPIRLHLIRRRSRHALSYVNNKMVSLACPSAPTGSCKLTLPVFTTFPKPPKGKSRAPAPPADEDDENLTLTVKELGEILKTLTATFEEHMASVNTALDGLADIYASKSDLVTAAETEVRAALTDEDVLRVLKENLNLDDYDGDDEMAGRPQKRKRPDGQPTKTRNLALEVSQAYRIRKDETDLYPSVATGASPLPRSAAEASC